MKDKTKVTEELYNKFAYLADQYARKLFGFDASGIGLEREDIVQECRIKIYTSIIAYGKKWAAYKKTGRYKPVPMLFYLQFCLNNKIKDLIKQINKGKDPKKKEGAINFMSLEDFNFDIGKQEQFDTEVDFKEAKVVVNGVDILEGLEGKEKTAFMMYLKGFPVTQISKIFKRVGMETESLISKQVQLIRSKEKEIFDFDNAILYSYSMSDND